MERSNISYSQALFDVATSCSAFRLLHKCKHQFNSIPCNSCDFFIKKYIPNTDEANVTLFMLEATSNANRIYGNVHAHRPWFIFGISVCLIFGVLCAYVNKDVKLAPIAFSTSTTSATVITPVSPPVQETPTVDSIIRDTLRQVQVAWQRGEDLNGDGRTNCIDASVLFYRFYPTKRDVKIMGTTGHLFVSVRIDRKWVEVEPQSRPTEGYLLTDIWGDKYLYTPREDVTHRYRNVGASR